MAHSNSALMQVKVITAPLVKTVRMLAQVWAILRTLSPAGDARADVVATHQLGSFLNYAAPGSYECRISTKRSNPHIFTSRASEEFHSQGSNRWANPSNGAMGQAGATGTSARGKLRIGCAKARIQCVQTPL